MTGRGVRRVERVDAVSTISVVVDSNAIDDGLAKS
jgi:hypothetical protein